MNGIFPRTVKKPVWLLPYDKKKSS